MILLAYKLFSSLQRIKLLNMNNQIQTISEMQQFYYPSLLCDGGFGRLPGSLPFCNLMQYASRSWELLSELVLERFMPYLCSQVLGALYRRKKHEANAPCRELFRRYVIIAETEQNILIWSSWNAAELRRRAAAAAPPSQSAHAYPGRWNLMPDCCKVVNGAG